ncbi:MAG: response regulator [Lachnospiraceae bacterium]|nr:response regulator [Lachnospiraceae bacterium]
MKSILIVEDEKMIRQGVHSMVARSDVPVEEILECKNGEEALEILRSRPVEVMITDIRMPKMDGITLIKHLEEFAHPPKTVVLSGYDDFHYAVEVLKGGARDYILKPIERQKINQILQQMEAELQKEEEERQVQTQMDHQQLKYVLLSSSEEDLEVQRIQNQLQIPLIGEGYRIVVLRPVDELPENAAVFWQLKGVEEQSVFLIRSDAAEKFLEEYLPRECCGISAEYGSSRSLRNAYLEARQSRITAFIRCKRLTREQKKENYEEKVPEEFAGQFVRQFGTENLEKNLSQLKTIFFQGRVGKADPIEVLKLGKKIWKDMYETYRKVIDMDVAAYARLRQPLYYQDASGYLEAFIEWMLQLKQLMAAEFDDYRNKEKINQALAYIHENYNKNLNMAMVSNYVSMNYSLFSVTFKQYTGQNFVNYVKTIRLEKAQKLLAETEEKVIDISQIVGYDNEKHFMKLFKNTYGVSPTEYRRNAQMGK